MRRLLNLFLAVTLFSVYLSAGIVLVQKTSAFSMSAVSTQDVTMGSTPTVGNHLIIGTLACCGAAQGVMVITDNQAGTGNVYNRQRSLMTSSFLGEASIYCAPVNVASGTFTITAATIVGLSDFITLFAVEYSGLSCEGDQSASVPTASGPVYACGSYTTLNANDLLVNVLALNAAGSFTLAASTGFTMQLSELNLSGVTGGYSDQVVTSTGSFSPSITATILPAGNCTAVALKAASGGGGSSGPWAFSTVN